MAAVRSRRAETARSGAASRVSANSLSAQGPGSGQAAASRPSTERRLTDLKTDRDSESANEHSQRQGHRQPGAGYVAGRA